MTPETIGLARGRVPLSLALETVGSRLVRHQFSPSVTLWSRKDEAEEEKARRNPAHRPSARPCPCALTAVPSSILNPCRAVPRVDKKVALPLSLFPSEGVTLFPMRFPLSEDRAASESKLM